MAWVRQFFEDLLLGALTKAPWSWAKVKMHINVAGLRTR